MRSGTMEEGMPAMTVLGPLLMLAAGLMAAVVLWCFLMLDPSPPDAAQQAAGGQQTIEHLAGQPQP